MNKEFMGNKMTIRKIKNRFKIIKNEISKLVEDKYVFEKYKEYIENSKNIDKQSYFLFWIAKNYQILAVINVCKQVDERNDVESLVNLLKDIKKLKSSFSLTWFVQEYSVLMRDKGKDDFKQFSIKSNQKVSVKKIDEDIKKIKKAINGERFGKYKTSGKYRQSIASLTKYRHKRVAHFASDNRKAIVPVEKLFEAIDLLEKMTIKYNLLLDQSGMNTLLSANIDEYIELDKVFKK